MGICHLPHPFIPALRVAFLARKTLEFLQSYPVGQGDLQSHAEKGGSVLKHDAFSDSHQSIVDT